MLTIRYKNRFFRFIERVSKGDLVDLINTKTDVLVKMELSLAIPEAPIMKGRKYKHSFVLNIPNFLIDLSQDENEIYKRIKKSTRADIRKATEIHHLTYVEVDHPTDAQINEFSLFYNMFAKEKKIAPCNKEKLVAIRDHNSLIMTYVVDEQNNFLCAGMLLVDRDYNQLYGLYGASTRLLQTASTDRRLIARANKYLHWKEIQSAKNRGMNWYNFGGEVTRKEDQGVNDFKKMFGTVGGYDRRIYVPKSMLGRVCVALLYRKWKRDFDMPLATNKHFLNYWIMSEIVMLSSFCSL